MAYEQYYDYYVDWQIESLYYEMQQIQKYIYEAPFVNNFAENALKAIEDILAERD